MAVIRTLGPLSTIEVSIMKSLIRSALLGAAGLAALSLSAQAAGSTAVTDTPLFKSTTTTESMQLAQRPENPGGAAGFRNENPGGGGAFRNENPGGGGAYKQTKKVKLKKKAAK
jgi:hypothetical protein